MRAMLRSGAILSHVLRHPSARLLVEDVDAPPPFKAVLASRLLTAGPAWIEDRSGRTSSLDARYVAGRMLAGVANWRRALAIVREAERTVRDLERTARQPRSFPAWNPEAGVLFLRAELAQGVVAGGSLAHLSGVLNALQQRSGPVDLVTSAAIPLLHPDVRVTLVAPEPCGSADVEIRQLDYNARLGGNARVIAAGKPGCLLYQRYSVHNWTGASLARSMGLPLVLEFNGPERWVAENWARPLRHAQLADRIERLALEGADLVTVVSEPLRAHLAARGLRDERILVNPNGVDLDRYRPQVDDRKVRERYGLRDSCTIGFIGTFGHWHGAEILAEAFARLLDRRADLRERCRLLLVGDGTLLPSVEQLLQRRGRLEETVLTGLVPQREGHRYLAACDILALPTVPNPDGSAFFGSPIKLFEYMAMGRAIAASAIGQIAEILVDGRTGLLVPAAEPEPLASALERLVDDAALRARLGAAARAAAEEKHGWDAHVSRLIARIDSLRREGPIG
jgi:glycosyltransferase involved in cell wall biosynthesis